MTLRPTVDASYADAYFGARLRSESWRAADSDSKSQALTQASFLISGAFDFSEAAYEIDPTTETIVWEPRICAAVCEEALWLLDHDPSELPSALFQGVVSASAGAVSATFDRSFVLPWIAPVVKTLVGDLASFNDPDDESHVKSTLLQL